MLLELIREERGATWTAGRLLIDGKPFCDTLEDTVRTLRSAADKVPGQTAIPDGEYRVRLTVSAKFRRLLPLLERVPYFSGVRIHAGNAETDTEGCILVGRRDSVAGKIAVGSRAIEAALVDTLRRETGEIRIKIRQEWKDAEPDEADGAGRGAAHKCRFI